MEKFLKNHKLTKDALNATECYVIEVLDYCEREVDVLKVYCVVDCMRVQKYYLNNPSKFWWSVKVTLI